MARLLVAQRIREDEYLGIRQVCSDPDSGELMEANDAGWTESRTAVSGHTIIMGTASGGKMATNGHTSSSTGSVLH